MLKNTGELQVGEQPATMPVLDPQPHVPLAQRKPPHAPTREKKAFKRLGGSRSAPLVFSQTKPTTASPTRNGDATSASDARAETMHEDAEDDVMEVEAEKEGQESEDGMEVEVVTSDRKRAGAVEDDVENRPPQPDAAPPSSLVRGWWVCRNLH